MKRLNDKSFYLLWLVSSKFLMFRVNFYVKSIEKLRIELDSIFVSWNQFLHWNVKKTPIFTSNWSKCLLSYIFTWNQFLKMISLEVHVEWRNDFFRQIDWRVKSISLYDFFCSWTQYHEYTNMTRIEKYHFPNYFLRSFDKMSWKQRFYQISY